VRQGETQTQEEDAQSEESQPPPEGKPMTAARALPKSTSPLIVVLAVLACWASSASAAMPWWHLDSGSRPATLVAGSARDEVEEVSVDATEGFFKLQDIEETGLESETKIARLPYNATAAEVQEGIEREVYGGAREVGVQEGQNDTAEHRSWVVTFPAQKVHPMGVISEELAGNASITELSRGQPDGQIVVSAINVGDAVLNPTSAVTILDTLPPGLRAVAFEAIGPNAEGQLFRPQLFDCSYKSLSCAAPVRIVPYGVVEATISVVVEPGATTGALNEASVSGGGVASVSARRPVSVSDQPAPFGVENYELLPEEEGGAVDTQAGSHPFQLTTLLRLNQTVAAAPVALAKDLSFKLPPGLIGNPTPFPQCTLAQFLARPTPGAPGENQCPPQTAVGVATPYVDLVLEANKLAFFQFQVPVFNLEPSVGEPARFGFVVEHTPVILDTSVRTGADYGVTVSVTNISQQVAFLSSYVTFWGVPGDRRHDDVRGWGCLDNTRAGIKFFPCGASEAAHPPPLLSLPTSCTGPMPTSVEADSWVGAGAFGTFSSNAPVPALDGCNRLQFAPEVKVSPDGQQASKPTGLSVDVHVPQEGQLNPTGLAQSNVKAISVTLPEGVVLNPSAADGLQACSEPQSGYLPGDSHPPSDLRFTAGLPEPLEQGLNFCPDASKVGTVKITSPLLPKGQFVEGAVYLATPAPNGEEGNNPFNSTVAMYIIAKDPTSGTIVKLPGSVSLNQQTGQISSTFENTPQLAFEDAELHFFGGERAPLATPAHCGTYTTEASFTPWSGNPPVKSSSSFQVTTGPNGGPCPGPSLPFTPTLAAGSPNINAGGFSPLTTTIGREDGNQDIKSVQLHMPPGLSGILAGVPLCPEAQANAGTCSPASQIGETIVSVGLGGDPFTVTGGKVYLTEKYGGGAFGLSIVNPADAGPFHLGKVVVRASIQVDPTTAQLTITTGEIPHIIKGFPLQIKHVNVLVNREHFTFNPTSCNPMLLTGLIGSDEGASSPVSVPFQATNCAVLKYTPTLKTATAAKASRTNGASLNFKIAYPKNAMGSQAWFNFARFQIPKQLPARLTTIQKACLATTFEHDRAACPAASSIGHALVHTQVLPVPLEGPVYFVSYGGAKFPDAVLVLKGYGITIELHGHTFINGKTGVTTATFESLPDVPFENIEVTVPQGPFSEFGANLPHGGLNFCGQKPTMPVSFKASNGLEIHQTTNVAVTGCPKTKTRAQKLAAALKACHKKHGHKRTSCERAARKRYGSKSSTARRHR
jgi:hypothetical protein